MKLIIDVEKDYYEMLKYNVEHGQKYKPYYGINAIFVVFIIHQLTSAHIAEQT